MKYATVNARERERERRLYHLPAVTTLAISHLNISSFERKVFFD